ncbi:MAG: hypothetical protein JO258_08020 [Alphaproteobacteria bacterium]|nr:hypothetical protein [Alphaproteobacteria bacterium]
MAFSAAASAIAAPPLQQNPSALAPPAAAPATTLPDAAIRGDGPGGHHYRVPAGYDSDPALHPYTSGLGPCTEGAEPSQGCTHPTGKPIPPSHYEKPPFNR